jgi:hypothetical protein
MYPAYPVNYSDSVQPGDSFTATVSTDGSGNFTLTLTDNTQGWTETQNQSSSSASLASAEVIAEAPSDSNGVLPLSNFGTVDFTGSTANGQSIGDYSPDNLTMGDSSTTKATTSSLSNGQDFSGTLVTLVAVLTPGVGFPARDEPVIWSVSCQRKTSGPGPSIGRRT